MAHHDPDFPTSDHGITDGLENTHNVVQVIPGFLPRTGYSLILAKDWKRQSDFGEQVGGVGNLIKIGLFVEKLALDAVAVQVYYCYLPIEVGLRDWMEYQAEKFGTRLTYCEDKIFGVGPVIEAGGIYGPVDKPHVVRLVAHADEGRIFLVSAMVMSTAYPAARRDIAIATNSFKLLDPGTGTQLEQWISAHAADPAFIVAHPATWSSRTLPPMLAGKSAIDLFLASGDKMQAYVRVKAVRRDALENTATLTGVAAEELREAGVLQASTWEPDPDPALNLIKGVQAPSFAKAKMNEAPVEIRFAYLVRGDLLFSVTAISAPKDADRMLWMRSKRAYHIALATAIPV